MKKAILIFLCSIAWVAELCADPPKSLNILLPPNTLYQAELSKTKSAQDNLFLKRIQGKFYTHKTDYHIFLSNLSYQDALKHFGDKGVALKNLNKNKNIAELENQKSQKLKPRIDLLNDPKYHESVGMFQGWVVNVYSYTMIAKQKINQTTIIFSKSVPKKDLIH